MKRFSVFLVLLLSLFLLNGCREAGESREKGVSLYIEGDYRGAAEAFLLARSQGDRTAVNLADLALSHAKLGEREEAEMWLQMALEKGGSEPGVLKREGLLLEALGDDEGALRCLNRSLTTPEEAMSREDLETCAFAAEIEERNGCLDEAVRLYDLLIDQGYYPMEHQLLAGLAYIGLHQTDAADQYFQLAAAHEEAPADYFLKICRGFLSEGEPERAEQWFLKGLSHLREGGLSKGAYYAYAGKLQEAFSFFEGENTASGLLAFARSLMSCRQYEKAETVLLKVIGMGEQLPEAYFEYLRLKILIGEYDDAKRLLTEVRALDDGTLSEAVDWNEIMMAERERDYETAFELLTVYLRTYQADPKALSESAFLSRAVYSE